MRKIFRRLVTGLCFGFVVYILLVIVADIRQVGSHLESFDWSLAPLILLGTLFNYLLRFFKWHYYLHIIGIQEISIRESARIFVAGFPLAVTPGKVGEALKGLWLNQVAKTPISHGVSVVLAERISDGFAVLLLSTLGVIAYPQYWPAFAIILAGLAAFVAFTQFRTFGLGLIRFFQRLPMMKLIGVQLQEFYEGSHLLFKPRATITAVTLGIFAWLGEGVAMYLVLVGLGVEPGGNTFFMAVFILSFSTVVGAVSALPGGIGAAEASITGMLTLLVGLDTGTSAAGTLLIRFATLWFGVGLGLVSWAFSKDLLVLEAHDNSTHEG
jgi:uncharacterized protein (TIRG00374 family)